MNQRRNVHGRIASLVIKSGLLVTLASATSGCAVINSKEHSEKNTKDNKETGTRPGLVYALPKGAVQLTAERKQVAAEDIKKAKDAADAAKANAEVSAKALATSKESLKKAEGELKTAPDAAKPKLAEVVALAQATVNYATVVNDVDAAVAGEAKAKYEEVAGKLNEWVETAALAVLPSAPDPTSRYVASLSHNITRDDNIKLSVSNGLLTSSTATATDQLPNILLSIAQTIGVTNLNLPKGVRSSMVTQSLAPPPADKPECSAYNVSVIFDPTNHADVYKKLRLLEAKKPDFTVTVDGIASDTPKEDKELAQPLIAPSCKKSQCPDGLYYRVPTAVEMQISSKDQKTCTVKSSPVAFSSVVVVPDSTRTYRMPTRAGAFTTTKLAFAFKEGMPVDYSVEQPSELASIASIPVQIAKALVSIPAEIIQLRVNHDTQANALIAAKAAEMTAQVEQLRAQQALDAAREAVAAGLPIPLPPKAEEGEDEAAD